MNLQGFASQTDLHARTKSLAIRIIRLFSALPKSTVAQVIGKQFLRSGTSVEANYCEAYRARSDAEFIAKVELCIQELEESRYWLTLLVESKIFPQHRLEPLDTELNELISIFTSSVKRVKNNING